MKSLLTNPQAAQRGFGFLIACGVVGLLAGTFATASGESFLAYVMLLAVTVTPVTLWLLAGSPGLPVLQLLAALYFIYYALPILRADPKVSLFEPWEILGAAGTVCLFIGAATLAWLMTLAVGTRRRQRSLSDAMTSKQLIAFIYVGLVLGLAFFFLVLSGYFALGSLIGVVRSIMLTATSVASFLLGHAVASGVMRGWKLLWALILLGSIVMLSWSTLFLVAGTMYILAALFGYIITARRVPWIPVAVIGILVLVLHAGKGELRQKYWTPGGGSNLTVVNAPGVMIEWFGTGVNAIASGSSFGGAFDRASLLTLHMMAKRRAPNYVPFLEGKTYTYLPSMLVPRFLNEDKRASQASMNLLNVHFGFLTRQEVAITAVGWGLIEEAYANYGNIAVLIVGAFMGVFTGVLTRWSDSARILSAPTLVTIAAMMILTNLEADFSYLFTSMFQGTCAVLLFLGIFKTFNRQRDLVPARQVALES
jgi:hypothetical protein